MHFDDRLATVLRHRASSDAIGRIRYRQLLDLLGSNPVENGTPLIDDAYLRLDELSRGIAVADRAAMLDEPALRLRSPRLIAALALAEPSIAAAAIKRAELSEEQWLDLIPALSVRARGIMRHRRGMGERVDDLLARLGVRDQALPAAKSASNSAGEIVDAPAETPSAPQPIEEIGAIVRRIEAYRKTRQLAANDGNGEAPRLPLDDLQAEAPSLHLDSFDFATDREGRIVWADAAMAPAGVGLSIAGQDSHSPARTSADAVAAFRQRQPIVNAPLAITGAPAIAGEWRMDAAPRFDQPSGGFAGYFGRMRRPSPEQAPSETEDTGDRMRQILHELRTPVNAIQGFAEIIQQQLYGPTPHEYRALAAAIAGDSARMLAGFEELDRFARLDAGVLALEPGSCDLTRIVTATVAQLQAFNSPRRSGFAVEFADEALPVALAQDEVARLIWRLLATLAGMTAPGEVLKLRARRRAGCVRLSIRLPVALAHCDDEEALFQAATGAQPPALTAGVFGTGFALRLAAAEANAAGGSLVRREDRLRLTLPGLTTLAVNHSEMPEPLVAAAGGS